MGRTLPHLLFVLGVTCLLWSALLAPTAAVPPAGWSGDDNLGFLLEVNGINAHGITGANPIPMNLSEPVTLELTIQTAADLTIYEGQFSMSYLGLGLGPPQVFDLSVLGVIPDSTTATIVNTSLPLGAALSFNGLPLLTGTITGVFSFIYANTTHPTLNKTVSENFVLRIGGEGLAAIVSVTGLVTAGFTIMSVFSLILALEHGQHAVSYEIPAHDVDGGEGHGRRAERKTDPTASGFTCGDERTDDGNAGDGVRPRHERRVERRRDLGDHLESDEDGQNEDREARDQAFHQELLSPLSSVGSI